MTPRRPRTYWCIDCNDRAVPGPYRQCPDCRDSGDPMPWDVLPAPAPRIRPAAATHPIPAPEDEMTYHPRTPATATP